MANKKVLIGEMYSGVMPLHKDWNTGDNAVDPDGDVLLCDAPSDGKQYLRKNGVWYELNALTLDEYGSLGLETVLPWADVETPGPAVLQWNDIAISETGQYITASGWDHLYVSSNYGVTFTVKSVSGNTWRGVSMSGDGQYQLAAFMGLSGKVYRSTNYGASWTVISVPDKFWIDTAVSYEGQYQIAVAYHITMRPAVVYISSDYGVTWTEIPALAGVTYGQAAISETGQYVVISDTSGNINYSSDYGATWSIVFTAPAGYFQGLDMSKNGAYITAGIDGGSLWLSHDYGVTWVEKDYNNRWSAVALSYSGRIQVAVSAGASRDVLFSSDYGKTWTEVTDKTLPSNEYTSIAVDGDGKLMVAGQWITGTQARLKLTRDFVAGNIAGEANMTIVGDVLIEGKIFGTIAYSPANSAHWAGDPVTIKEAVDRLADALYTHQGNTPIA